MVVVLDLLESIFLGVGGFAKLPKDRASPKINGGE
jgi:hypothetical protein